MSGKATQLGLEECDSKDSEFELSSNSGDDPDYTPAQEASSTDEDDHNRPDKTSLNQQVSSEEGPTDTDIESTGEGEVQQTDKSTVQEKNCRMHIKRKKPPKNENNGIPIGCNCKDLYRNKGQKTRVGQTSLLFVLWQVKLEDVKTS
ncbi:hypothetical protein LDENG_00254190 [Lucifuga dentata]|nr:hypothetical protein LDENG_00254190 [Lucifuga dentata]